MRFSAWTVVQEDANCRPFVGTKFDVRLGVALNGLHRQWKIVERAGPGESGLGAGDDNFMVTLDLIFGG